MKIKVLSQSGEVKKEVSLPDSFDDKINPVSMARYLNYVNNSARMPIANTKNRGEVSGGGKKPWKQKGTGNARAGSSRSPLWVGGGVTFGPTPDRNYFQKQNKKFRQNIKNSILARFAKEKRLILLEKIDLPEIKTRLADKIVEKLKIEGKVSLFLSVDDLDTAKAFKNLPYAIIMNKNYIDVANLISSDYVLMTFKAYQEIVENKVTEIDKVDKEQTDEANN